MKPLTRKQLAAIQWAIHQAASKRGTLLIGDMPAWDDALQQARDALRAADALSVDARRHNKVGIVDTISVQRPLRRSLVAKEIGVKK